MQMQSFTGEEAASAPHREKGGNQREKGGLQPHTALAPLQLPHSSPPSTSAVAAAASAAATAAAATAAAADRPVASSPPVATKGRQPSPKAG